MGIIAVVGPALLDIIGTPLDVSLRATDRPGLIDMQIGGVAVNLATDLCKLGARVELVSPFGRQSDLTSLVKRKLTSVGIGLTYSFECDQPRFPAFLGIMKDGQICEAITWTGVEDLSLQQWRTLPPAVKNSSLVIAETNLATELLLYLHELSEHYRVPMCLVCASDAKASRLLWGREHPIALISLNSQEAQAIGLTVSSEPPHDNLRKSLSAERVLLSFGADGAVFCDDSGSHIIKAPQGVFINTLGAGDALVAAVCLSIEQQKIGGPISDSAAITETVAEVLASSNGSLAGAELRIS